MSAMEAKEKEIDLREQSPSPYVAMRFDFLASSCQIPYDRRLNGQNTLPVGSAIAIDGVCPVIEDVLLVQLVEGSLD